MTKRKFYVEKKLIKSANKDMKILIIRPTVNTKPKNKATGILWIHGGGYITGMAEMIYISRAIDLVKKYGAVVITPEYRLSKEAPYPAALEDCYTALRYLKEHSDQLGVNSSQLMIGGESAGGGLTAALCMYARDKGEINIAFQMPLYPMMDDRYTNSSIDNHNFILNTKTIHLGWKIYLGKLYGKKVPPYAAAARQTDYSNLPPAYTFVGDKEIFYSKTLNYIKNLNNAGIKACVDVYPTKFHSFDMFTPFRKISKQAISEFEKQYLYATEHYFAPQP